MWRSSSGTMTFSTTVPIIIFLVLLANRLRKIGSRASGLPPGPPTKSILGNILDFPQKALHIRFTEWAKVYGEIYSLKIGPGTVIVISSPRMVRELLDKRSSSTAGRPPLYFGKLVTDGLNMGFLPYEATYKNMRRSIMNLVNREACMEHAPVQQAEANQLMYDILKEPQGYYTHVERYAISFILAVAFGVRCPRHESSLIAEFCRLEHDWESLIAPGHHPPVDLLPILLYVPERWAAWKGICRDLGNRQRKLYFGLFEACEKRIQNKTQYGCFIERVIEQKEKLGLTREMVGYVGVAALQGGSTTTTAFLRSLICCLATHLDVQQRAHDEISRVVGIDRTPVMKDIERLPYIRAIIKEVHRFCPSVPYGLPHYSTSEEVVDQYTVPKNSIIFMNTYGIYHDESAYTQPGAFNPERYMESEYGTTLGMDDSDRRADMHFGAGRRICPGMILGNNSITLNAMNLIWAFDFDVAMDPLTGAKFPVEPSNFTEDVITSCTEFPSDILPRSEAHSRLIRTQYAASRPIFSQFEYELSPEDAAFAQAW